MTKFNEDKTRAITEAPFGIACYEGAVAAGFFSGTHQGVCRDWKDAEAWLNGNSPESFVRVYPLEMRA